jgi:protein O-mannosyl-transferase
MGSAIALMVLLAYVPALRGGYIWDDDFYVTQNSTLRTTEGLWRIWTQTDANVQYYPLVFTSFWLEYRGWKLNPFGYHLVNVVLHILNALLIWRILRQLGVHGAWLAAAFFAVHPVHVESVAWITERKNVLSGFFYLGALSVYLRFAGSRTGADSGSVGRAGGRPWGLYASAVFLFLCALLSKTVTASLPAALLVILWWKRGRLTKRDVLPLVPLFVLGALLGSMTAWLEKFQVSSGQDWGLSAVERLLVAGRAIWFYLSKILLPVQLTFSYPRWSIDDTVWWQYLYPVAAGATMIILYLQRKRLGRGPLAVALYFAITLAPALGFLDFFPMRYSFVADHFQYLASIGPILLVSATLVTAGGNFAPLAGRPCASPARPASIVLGGSLLVALVFLTWNQSTIYRSMETLWRDTIAKNPGSWLAYNNLGLVHYHRGELEQALPYFRKAVELNPDHAEAQNNLGLVHYDRGELERALPYFQEAVRIKPDFAKAHYNLALALFGLGRQGEGYSHFTTALRLAPGIGLKAPQPPGVRP